MALATTTKITITLSNDIIDDTNVQFNPGTTGAQAGSLVNIGGGVYELPVSDITQSGNVQVTLIKPGYAFVPNQRTVMVNYVP